MKISKDIFHILVLNQYLLINYTLIFKVDYFLLQYDTNRPGFYGGGGEYEIQSGFGWTNGVVFEFLDVYCAAAANDNALIPAIDCNPIPI